MDKATNGKLVNQLINGHGMVTIDNPSVNVIEVISPDVPVAYELLQKLSESVQSSTTIKFGIPEKANVKLTIYNQLGEQVCNLLNGEFESRAIIR